MGLLDSIHNASDDEKEGMSSINEAEQVAEIITKGIEKGEFGALSDEILELPSTNANRTRYVYDRPFAKNQIRGIAVCLVGSILFLYFMAIGLGTLMYSTEYAGEGFFLFSFSLTFIVFNIALSARAVRQIQFMRRYDKYENMLRYQNISIVDDLASFTGIEQAIVVKDLRRAISKKYIPQGHLGRENIIFITSDEVYQAYQEKPAVYDRYYRKVIEERARMKQRTENIQKIMELGQSYVSKIHDSNDIIKDKIISQKLDRMENIVKMIFHEVDVNPAQADKLGLFLNYYLPTTEKLLTTYIEIDEKQVQGGSLEKTKKEIENALDTIIKSFEGILDKFYQEQAMDIVSDISAMEIIMQQEGLQDAE